MNAVNEQQNREGARLVPAAEGLEEAAERLQSGRLVAFPTETVYGLGANALDAEAVAGIFTAKGRPASNPLIVHIADLADIFALIREWPDTAAALAERFWPGPLTLVLPKSAAVPDIATAGGDTVAVRMPSQPIALELLRRAGVPVAAPSANRSEEVSPTTAEHVAASLGPFAPDLLILDGGPCSVGLESTVLDVTVTPPAILRPGMLSATDLEAVVGAVTTPPASPSISTGEQVVRSPGQMTRHYAPRVPLVLTDTPLAHLQPGDGVLAWRFAALPDIAPEESGAALLIAMPADATGYAARLYGALHELDAAGVTRILVEMPPDADSERHAWAAVHDRLRRAAAPKESA